MAAVLNKEDILYWIRNEPRFGRQAVYLDDIDPTANPPLPRLSLAEMCRGGQSAGFYWMFDLTNQVVKTDSDMLKGLDVLAKKVGVIGVFSDWPGTVSYYASCMGLK